MSKNKKIITKENWSAKFSLVGKAKVTDNTFKIDAQSEKSAWIYNSLNLGVDCGEKYGVIFSDLMGGYSANQDNVIYAHGKKEDGSDDYEQQIQVDWEDRFNPEVLDSIGDLCFITVGLEKTDKDKTFYKKFLSPYDAIAYVQEHLEDGMIVSVRGNIRYSLYQDEVQVKKNITSIALSRAEDSSKFYARFTQTVLLDKSSASLKNIDKDKGVMYVDAIVLDYLKELNGIEIKGQYPYKKQFEFEMDFTNQERCKKIMDKVFKVRKGFTQITFEGEFIEGGAVVTATLDDIPDDIKDLIECGIYTEEEALARCSTNGNRERRMVLRKPAVRLVGEDKTPVLQCFEEKYTEDDLYLDYLFEESPDEVEEKNNNISITADAGDLDWLDALD